MTSRRERELERICLSALERPAAERAAFLEAACEGDEELRREAESLIARDQAAGSFLEAPPIPDIVSAVHSAAAPVPAIAAGDRIGSYTIVSTLGIGGMGEVYRAFDETLGREVAIKVLPSLFTNDPQRVERFEREARLLATLNHPNIATIHGVERANGICALVLELVDGETLTERLRSAATLSAGRGLPVATALSIARQIADALEAAHEKGIVHRDLKPANVMIRSDGVVKLLDFGLAKTRQDDCGSLLPAHGSPIAGSTEAGVIAGTAAYMSPEQARGEPVDRRADVWAFGCVLYEMLTGRKVFEARRTLDILAAICEQEPLLDALPAETPEGIRRLLRRALTKDPRIRLRDIADARLELTEALDEITAPGARSTSGRRAAVRQAPGAPTRSPLRLLLPLGIAAALAVAFVLGWTSGRQSPGPPKVVSRFELIPPEPAPLLGSIAISSGVTPPRIAYVTNGGVAVRVIERLDPRVIRAGTGLLSQLFLSSDGRWIGYVDDGLRKVSIDGGPSVLLARAGAGATAAWGDRIIVLADMNGLFIVPPGGGTPERVSGSVFASDEQPAFPEILPRDAAVLYTVVATRTNTPIRTATALSSRIEALDLRTGARKVVVRGGGRPRYISSGYLVYGAGTAIKAVPFDAARLETRGDPVQVADEGASSFALSREGTLVYRRDGGAGGRTVVWVDRKGREEDLGLPPGEYIVPRLSPDGGRVALDVGGADRNIWVWDMTRRILECVTSSPAEDALPRWSRDGQWLYFASVRDGPVPNIYRQAADRSGTAMRVLVSDRLQHLSDVAPDGTLLIGERAPDNGQNDILMFSPETRELVPLIATEVSEGGAAISPDGRWIAYESIESGQIEVYVRPYPKVDGGQWKVSRNGGRQAVWSRDGSELFYRDYEGALIAVPVSQSRGARFEPGTQLAILPGNNPYAGSGAGVTSRTYDVSLDGSRFLMIKIGNANHHSPLIVVQNWSEELKGRVPAR